MDKEKKFYTTSGIEIKRVYVPNKETNHCGEDGSLPGEFPYTRGIQSEMYRTKLWTMRQYAGFGTPEESNARYRYLLEQGQTGLSVAFDLPTQIGYDSDHEISQGEVGKVGVAIDTLDDMELLLKDIPLDQVSISMTINSSAAILLAMYIVMAKKQGIPLEKLRGTIQNDILKEYIARGTYIFPVEPSMRLITDIFQYCSGHIPKWNSISISGYHIREAGANAVQEIAFTLANGITYVQAAVDAGLQVDDFAPRLSFFFNAHNHLFEEVAKFRAARRIWAKLMKERFGAKNEKSMMLRFHTQTAGSALTAQQHENNVVRVTIQALAAILGGTQSLHTNSRDEALALPNEDSVTIALRTQQILAYESGAAETADPLGGSYFVESLTDEIEVKALDYMEKIEKMGGVAKAIEKGYLQKEIQDSAYRYQREVEEKRRIVVGVNSFETEEKKSGNLLRVNPEVEENQKKRLAVYKKNRNQENVKLALEALREACGKDHNLMEYIIKAVEKEATLGEICGTLRQAFGEYVQTVNL
ncbi:acyl-CoA mutase large subunit family protein [Sinanaerobacter chloroacetimidivorans]|uniref:Methylmalonyl-CoA mutase family protein n=1 Tax=Sinanaerobacter chloroacetimidivorans TaxID=2818044 RepID=A0A8J8B0M9_9FIRM|nr:methylmalonyl-CoA mutase family protein [Sinanaerobacter chloroacetimidivorans]MBR0596947.1 methylmalonyl-CoA mutase family protein [Sinanaerobacter chloroacetimidivorans]